MSTLHKTTQPAYDKYGNKVEAKATVQAAESQWERDLDRSFRMAEQIGGDIIDAIRNRLDVIGREDETFQELLMETLGSLGRGRIPNKQAFRSKLAQYKLELHKLRKSRPSLFD